MNDDERERLLERERLQFQMIRQLDLEQLEVEEVDYSDEDEDAESEVDEEYAIYLSQLNSPSSPTSSAEFTFDTYITPLHSYLGGTHLYCTRILCICAFFSAMHSLIALFLLADVEDTRHRTAFLDGGAVLNIPLFCLRGICKFDIKWILK